MKPSGIREIRPNIMVIEDLLTPEECRAIIGAGVLAGFADKQQRLGRHNAEVFIENQELSIKIEACLLCCGLKIRLDDLFEIYRYSDGQHITVHADVGRPIRHHCQSNVTLLIYLSDDFLGGRTLFTEAGQNVAPAVGRAVLFDHGVLHAAEAVSGGVKYVVRVDAHASPFTDLGTRTDAPLPRNE